MKLHLFGTQGQCHVRVLPVQKYADVIKHQLSGIGPPRNLMASMWVYSHSAQNLG